MNKIYIVEWKANNNIVSKIINSVTNTGYTHTGMIIQSDNLYYYADLAGVRKKAYKLNAIDSIENYYMLNKNKTKIKIIPKRFTMLETYNILGWWKNKTTGYGYLKILSFLAYEPLLAVAKLHYKMTGKVFKPILGNVIKHEIVCSGAVDKCLKEAGKYDSFPELDEDLIVPGKWANNRKFKLYRGKKCLN